MSGLLWSVILDQERPVLTLKVDFPSAFPFFVLTNTTPFAACEPYIEADAASFKTEILSISAGFTTSIFGEITPSIKIRGEVLFNVPSPRMVICAPSAPAIPDDCAICTPAILPAKLCEALVIGRLSSCFTSRLATAPVRFTFFCAPYPTTTTSSRSCEFSFNMTFTYFRPLMATSCSSKPI